MFNYEIWTEHIVDRTNLLAQANVICYASISSHVFSYLGGLHNMVTVYKLLFIFWPDKWIKKDTLRP